jgi:hypothetical protein
MAYARSVTFIVTDGTGWIQQWEARSRLMACTTHTSNLLRTALIAPGLLPADPARCGWRSPQGIAAVATVKLERLRRMERGLRHKTWPPAVVWLSSVDEERMAKIDGTSLPGC